MTHFALLGSLLAALSIVAVFVAVHFRARLKALEAYAEASASHAFEAAKPAIIHTADQIVDTSPSDIPLTALEGKITEMVTTALAHLLALNPLLSPSVGVLTLILLPLLKLLPADVDVATYKTRLKSAIAKAIQGARL